MQLLWKFVLRRLAHAQGFMDPMVVFSNLQYFSKPSEVWVPVELLRSGAVLQARGLINSQAIQHNLDWVWPHWVERQFNPNDKAFIPRAFSLTHINLTHRNWTALGLPDLPDFPIVDPCGLVTPFFDGWSVDAWIVYDKNSFVPSRQHHVDQTLDMKDGVAVVTSCQSDKFVLVSRAEVKADKSGEPVCFINVTAQAGRKAWLMICVRPYNPEGISFIKDIHRLESGHGWVVNKKEKVFLDKKPLHYVFGNHEAGDLVDKVASASDQDGLSTACKAGMATSAALFPLEPEKVQEITIGIPLLQDKAAGNPISLGTWPVHLRGVCRLKVPDQNFEFLYDAAVRTIILHSSGDIYPGPFTYKRFWFRDAAFIVQAMIALGLSQNVEKLLDRFLERQTPLGYFKSQDGEWDSNGQAIWIMKRFGDVYKRPLKKEWLTAIYRAAGWIERKRAATKNDPLHAGLLPAGFSAEHFGPSDFYYWDDFWGVAGLREAAILAGGQGNDAQLSSDFQRHADDLLSAVESSAALAQERSPHAGIAASASRRMDAAAVGCLVAAYPLQIWGGRDERVWETANFLINKYFLLGAFYYEISHSGINIYLSLHIAQVLLRAGDPRSFGIVKAVADLATPTGQWPEAIHPRTRGGCMGDGQHVWASAEWVMILHNMFVREEQAQRKLILCSGIPKAWLVPDEILSLGPAQTLYGEISITIHVKETVEVTWAAKWSGPPPQMEVHLPGHEPLIPPEGATSVHYEYINHDQYI